jgi:hypothetical protein
MQSGWTREKNHRRCLLIDADFKQQLTDAERWELDCLQAEMLAYRQRVAPLPLAEMRGLRDRLFADGKIT